MSFSVLILNLKKLDLKRQITSYQYTKMNKKSNPSRLINLFEIWNPLPYFFFFSQKKFRSKIFEFSETSEKNLKIKYIQIMFYSVLILNL